MNTKSLLTRIGVPVLSLGLLGGPRRDPGHLGQRQHPASHGHRPGPREGVPDTTFGDAGRLPSVQNGPVWAYDNLERKLVAVQDQTGPTLWHVTLSTQGSFQAFASPITARADHRRAGPGWVTHDIRSATTPARPTSRAT